LRGKRQAVKQKISVCAYDRQDSSDEKCRLEIYGDPMLPVQLVPFDFDDADPDLGAAEQMI
jgi:hypothetical protein